MSTPPLQDQPLSNKVCVCGGGGVGGVVNGDYSFLFSYGSVMVSTEIPEGHVYTRAAMETAPGCMGCNPQEAGK